VEASKLRLRPILMTSLAFTLGVLPLLLAKGAGAEMRVALGLAVFSGMVGVTIFGIFFTPVFYSTIRWFSEIRGRGRDHGPSPRRSRMRRTRRALHPLGAGGLLAALLAGQGGCKVGPELTSSRRPAGGSVDGSGRAELQRGEPLVRAGGRCFRIPR